MNILDRYIDYLCNVRRYSARTVSIYKDVLERYVAYACDGDITVDAVIVSAMNRSQIRSYVAGLMDSPLNMSSRTVSLHMSALSGFCRYLVKEGHLSSNPVRLVVKPRQDKNLPVFFRDEAMTGYFESTSCLFDRDAADAFVQSPDSRSGAAYYRDLLDALIIRTLYSLGIRRSELSGLCIGDVDFARNVVKVRGKGDKMREIPLLMTLSEEILLYLKAVEAMCGGERSLKEPLFVTYSGSRLYPEYVNRAVRRQLEGRKGFTGRKSPHVLRHSLATGLLEKEADLNSIKELLGHSSLAATQVYTHSSIARLKTIYEQAHPRAKNGGKNGD